MDVRTGNGHELPHMWDKTVGRMAWRKRHEKATNVPRLSPNVPSSTENREKPLPALGSTSLHIMLQRNWRPKFPAVELGITDRHEGAEVAHVKSLRITLGAGKRAGI